MMVEHHLGQQEPGEEPEGAARAQGPEGVRPPGITDTAAESRPHLRENIQCVQAAEGPAQERPV